MKKLIRKNNNGELYYNIHKNEFYVEFGTVMFTLHMDNYLEFERKIKEISSNIDLYNTTEKIQVPVKAVGIILNITSEELLSLRDLFGFKSSNKVSFKMKINYSMN
ncbi:MAG: hypothetical protein PF517_09645 [Salinivirgaceae bacterium]|jgi:hypothetical protein|nr:hypothetical protein [Salinivirgaceae bacterium]